MAAILYPRINPTIALDPSTGSTITPFRIPPTGGGAVTISDADATAAETAMPAFSAGDPAPNAPAGVVPFRVEHDGVTHLRVAFHSDPAGSSPPSGLPGTTYIALVPRVAVGPSGLTVTPGGSPNVFVTAGAPGFRFFSLPGFPSGANVSVSSFAATDVVLPLELSTPNGTGLTNATWFLVVSAPLETWVTLAVADSALEAEIPWIHVPSTSSVLDFVGSLTPGSTTTGSSAGTVTGVRNFGTGPLQVLASSAPDPTGGDVVIVNATTIDAAQVGTIGLDYTVGDGLAGLAVPVDSDDTESGNSDYHNAQLTVSAAVAAPADTVLVLDASGSMLLRPDGSADGDPDGPTPAARRRWDNLESAVAHLIDGYFAFLNDPGGAAAPDSRIGISIFPDVMNKSAGWTQRAAVLVPSDAVSSTNFDDTLRQALQQAGDEVAWAGWTPLGDGVATALSGGSSGGGSMYDPNVADFRRWMVLMTDGHHNAGSPHPSTFLDSTKDLLDEEVRMFSIGYTTESGGTAVQLLNDLADNALNPAGAPLPDESRYAQAALFNSDKDLIDTFLDAMATSIGLEPTHDPAGELTVAAPVAVHEFQVSPYDTGAGVFVDWASPSAKRVQLALISPLCERFEAADLEQHPDFRHRAQPSYAHAYISSAALSGGGSSPPRYGTWKLELKLSPEHATHDGHGAQSEPYKFSIFTRSGIRLSAWADGTRWRTGQPIEIFARLSANGAPIDSAQVVANLDTPGADYGTLLAAAPIDRRTVDAMLEADEGTEAAGTWALKAKAVGAKFGPITIPRGKRQIVLQQVSPGLYRGTVEPTIFSGVYQWHVVATGFAGTVPFRRERALTSTVAALPHPKRTTVSFELGPKGHLMVRVRPRDAFGNVVVFDPPYAQRLRVEVAGGKPVTDVVNMFDGSYSQAFELYEVRKPAVRVIFDDKVVYGPKLAVHPGNLGWMAQVLKYDAGAHEGDATNPKHALGPVKLRDDPFVCIGGGGSITLTNDRGRFSASHIAVFAQPDSDETYTVFVRQARRRHAVPIGKASGPITMLEVPPWGGTIESVIVANPNKGSKGCVRLQAVGFVPRERAFPGPMTSRFDRG